MDETQTPTTATGRVLATLFLGMFVMGSTELLVVGLLDLMAADLGLAIPAAGTLVTVYALGLAIGGPVLTAVTVAFGRRTVLVGALALFVVTTAASASTSHVGLLLAVRGLTGALQGVFIAAAFSLGTAVAPPARAGRAIAVVMSGVTVSGALGVPLGTLAGQTIGWRGSFWAAAGLAVVVLALGLALLPAVPGSGAGVGKQAASAFGPRVLVVLLLTTMAFAAVYAALTYVVPYLRDVTGVPADVVGAYLLAYGVAAAGGAALGGRFADARAAVTLVVGCAGVAGSLAVWHLGGTVPAVVALAVVAAGLCLMAMAPSMQVRVVELAGAGGALAQSLPASAANVGIAVGSWVGGLAVAGASTPGAPAAVVAAVPAGIALALAAIPVAWMSRRLRPPATRATAAVVASRDEPTVTPERQVA